MVRRHIGRDPKRADGVPRSALTQCERRLGVQLPESIRDYYLLAGRLNQLNKAHNVLFEPEELHIKDGYLWFMEENQAVVHWAVPEKQLAKADPMVYQRVNADGTKWYSEKMPFSTFIVRMYDWQAGFADAPT